MGIFSNGLANVLRTKPEDLTYFPQRAMTLAEAVAIHVHCVELRDSGTLTTMVVPLSELPPGGYFAVVEAFARMYVDLHPVTDDNEARHKFRIGLLLYADSIPDTAVMLLEGPAGDRNGAPDAGVRLARAQAVALREAVWAVQMDHGYRAFEERVDQLRASASSA